MANSIVKVGSITGIILLIPLAINTFWGSGVDGTGFNWKIGDFVVVGLLLFITGLGLDLIARKVVDRTKRVYGFSAIAIGFLWLYAELAVGIFTNWGS